MKKFLLILMAALLVFALFACGEKPNEPGNTDPTPVDPTPVDPTPVDPTPVDPTPVDPTPVDPTPGEQEELTEEQVLLMATFYTDSRAAGQKIGVCGADGTICIIEEGEVVSEANLQRLEYDGERIPDELVGGPAIICKNKDGVVKKVKPIEGAMLVTSQYRFTRDEEGNYLHDGEPIQIDVDALDGDATCHTFYKPQSLYFNNNINIITNKTWGLDSLCDDYMTLWDANNDGAYDFVRLIPVCNGGKVTAINAKTITVCGGFGSPFSMYTWNNGAQAAQYSFWDESLASELQVGDFINYYYQFDNSVSSKVFNTYPARIVIIDKCKSGTEVLEFAEGSDLDITCKFNGVEYKWSNTMFNSDGDGLFDGLGGATAGRTLMDESNYGAEITYACDRSGKIVYAEFPPDYTRADVILYATYTRNLRITGTSNPYVADENKIAVILDGTAINDASAFQLEYYGPNRDELVGLPVTLIKDADGNVVDIELRGKQVQFISGEAVLAGSEIRIGKDRYKVDSDRWGDKTYAMNSWALNSAQYAINIKLNNDRMGISSTTDEIITMVDRDKDGVYDFIRSWEIWNAIAVPLVLDDQIILGDVIMDGDKQYIYGTFGSTGSTGWIDGQKSWYFTKAEGVELPDFGVELYVNGVLFLNCASDTVPTGKLGAEFYITSICEKKTGVFTDITYTSVTDITCKVDGKAMKWSNNYSAQDYADGKADDANGVPAGHRAGRNLMTPENNGKTFEYWCDTVGNIVRVRLVEG